MRPQVDARRLRGQPADEIGIRPREAQLGVRLGRAHRRTRQIRRLLRFVSDVERCGFFDDHLYPMAPYFAALARAGVSMDQVKLVKTDELDAKLPSIRKTDARGHGDGDGRPGLGADAGTGGDGFQ